MSRTTRRGLLAMTAGILFVAQLGAAVYAGPEHIGHPGDRVFDGRGRVLDGRYNHGHFYPAIGASVHALPDGYHPYFWGGRPFYFAGGVWYAPGGPGFVVVRPPAGLIVSVLPPDYTTVWIGGMPYYYANEVYYSWNSAQNGYVVVDPPADADHPTAAPAGGAEDLFIYPKNGQTSDQQAADRYECHSWAKSQTHFDPTAAGGGVPANQSGAARSSYNRAMSACLTGRGYEVK
jgi:hypothetical protein